MAYQLYPALPPGLLEAIAHTRTRIRHVQPDREDPSCSGLPAYWGPMALVEDGKGWFRNSLEDVSRWSGTSADVLKRSAEQQILAYARALYLQSPPALGGNGQQPDPLAWDWLLMLNSELPLGSDAGSQFVMDSYLYGVYSSMNDPVFQGVFGTPAYQMDLAAYFDTMRYGMLTAPLMRIGGPCSDYPGVNWVAAHSSNYSSRSGTAISAVTVHTMQGYYAGTISWFQNPSANVSAHYCLRSSDGQITQMVCESDKAWHVGSENGYTVGLEHEGFVSDPAWYTPVMYSSSAALTRDIADDYGINPLRTYFKEATSGLLTLGACTRIKGHQHYPAQTHTDPGINWDWAHYYRLVNEPVTPTILSASSGMVYDPGGAGAPYGNDQRAVTVIQPVAASSVNLSFSAFDLENNWDYLMIYNGPNVFSPMLGSFTGSALPPALSASSGAMTLEFRSDCSVTAAGFAASWNSSGSSICAIPSGTYTGPIGWTSATVNWNPVPGATQYQVQGRKAGTSSWRSLITPLSSKWLGIFQTSSTYEWKVRASCPGVGLSDWSPSNYFTTNTLKESGFQADSLSAQSLKLWPQPAAEYLWASWSTGDQLEVYDAQGRLLLQDRVQSPAELNLSQWVSGWYLIRVGEAGSWQQKAFLIGP